MNREYKIGAYVFQTYEEYSDGLDDVNTIRYIVDQCRPWMIWMYYYICTIG